MLSTLNGKEQPQYQAQNDPCYKAALLHLSTLTFMYMMQIGNEQFHHDPVLSGTKDLQELSKTRDIVSARRPNFGAGY
ncbi:hypothetical protein SAMN04487859_1661 [Roseovarius lutimaris]|uniref:Uncharacterized protein n=1 Tax=Roseovarius lutimaris TaxID=1005928 RepID=A0A1I5H9M2_9RHOB|nr:hypothetical protein SAMN04487859_1661 [Roseovarius lutimaris]